MKQHDELKTHQYKIGLSFFEEFRTIVHRNDFSIVSEEPCPKDDNYLEGVISGPGQNFAKLRKEVKLWCKRTKDEKDCSITENPAYVNDAT